MSTLTPRVVLVHRRSELDELVARHGTRGHAAWFLGQRGQSIDELDRRAEALAQALATVRPAVPTTWRTGEVERADLDRFLFAPEDVVVVVGQDGLVANVAKYLKGQLVIGVNADPSRNPGVLVRHQPDQVRVLLADLPRATAAAQHRTMVQAVTDDGQSLVALNELYLGQPSHQTARWTLRTPEGRTEAQATSGLLVGTGTGATGWCSSVARERGGAQLPGPTEAWLTWFVREAWPSAHTGTELTAGTLAPGSTLEVTVESDGLVLFGDGIEADRIILTYGQVATFSPADRALVLV